MNEGRLPQALPRKIAVVPYDPHWSRLFREEADRIAAVLGPEVVAIHHIGSTAIPTASAKPTIDILVEVRDIQKIDGFNAPMTQLGYQPKGEFGIPGRRFFTKPQGSTRTHNVHIFQSGDPSLSRDLDFRDYMNAHFEEAQAYSRLKEELARKYPEDIESYNQGKDGFIKEMIRRAKAWRENGS